MAKSYPRFLGGICANVRTNGPAPGTPTAYVLICVGELNKMLFSMFCFYIFVGLHYFGLSSISERSERSAMPSYRQLIYRLARSARRLCECKGLIWNMPTRFINKISYYNMLEKYFGRCLHSEYILRAENEFYWNVVCVKAFSRPVQNGAWLAVHSSGASDNRTTGGCPAAPASTLLANKRGQFVRTLGTILRIYGRTDCCDLCLDWSNQLVFYTKYTNPMKPIYMYGTSGPATGPQSPMF